MPQHAWNHVRALPRRCSATNFLQPPIYSIYQVYILEVYSYVSAYFDFVKTIEQEGVQEAFATPP